MAKKKQPPTPPQKEQISPQQITSTLEENYMPYAMSVIVSRAIPEIDGLKPSHRKLLYTMYQMGLMTGARAKSSKVVGQTMTLNPHGDAAIYETLVRLTEGNGALLHPLVDSKGNFGKQYSRDMAYAAPRYTEVKLNPICAEFFSGIDQDAVDFVDNFDATAKEPLLLPTSFPHILVNPNQGIAVGMASSFCSFNLREICEATIALIQDPNVSLLPILKAPDLPTGALLLYDPKEMEEIYRTGRGSFKLRARYHFDEKNHCIEITEIPYTTTVEVIVNKIISLAKAGKLREITDVRDEIDRNGFKLAIDIRKNTQPDLLMEKLYQMTPLQDSFNCNFNLLIGGVPKTLGIKGILSAWLDFRLDSLRRQISFDVSKKSQKLHLLEGLEAILLDIDRVIAIIRQTEKESQVVPNLMAAFSLDKDQAEYIAEIRLRNINREYILNRTKEKTALAEEVQRLQETLKSERKLKNLICRQLREVAKKYGQERRTGILPIENIQALPVEDWVEDYPVWILLTEEGYCKKIPVTSRTQGEQKLKEEDRILQQLETTNAADLLFFSDRQTVYKLKTSQLPDGKPQSLGEYLPNLLGLEDGEKLLYVVATTTYQGNLLFFFVNGKAAKVPLSAYQTKTNRKKLKNAYSDKSPLLALYDLAQEKEFLVLRDRDKACLFSTTLLPLSATKTAGGIQVYTLKKNSAVTAVLPVEQLPENIRQYFRTTKLPTTGHFLQEEHQEILFPLLES
ncbi:MAG TPA: topoisomerase IV [Firmicutes bacterium]|nr:topoisomerase IV [Bacillota bacterium]